VPTLPGFIVNTAAIAFLAAHNLLAATDPNLLRFLSKYGYFAILFAAFWEGEAVLIAAGVLCGSGYLDWRLTIIAAAIGGSAGDQIYFYAAHERAARLINKSKRMSKWYPKISKFVLRHGTIAVLLSRFATGLRITIPLVCATAGMSPKKYSPLNLISAFAWASFWVALMYQVGARVHAG
jgi:membrane protein DedA with SNARE-associated domain